MHHLISVVVSPSFNGNPLQGILATASGLPEGLNGMPRSGDGTVPYMSLAWSHAWHVDSKIHVQRKAERLQEYYTHLLGRWGERNVLSLMNTVEPESHRYTSEKV